MNRPLCVLHVSPSLGMGGREVRLAALIDGLGDGFRHELVALDGNVSFLSLVTHRHRAVGVPSPPAQSAFGSISALRALIRARRPDLVSTYNWGAMDAVVAALLSRRVPLVHTEDGFAADEATRLLPRRVWARRILLRRADAVVMISRTLAEVARARYGVPARRLHFIPNGIDTARFLPGRGAGWRESKGIPTDCFLVGAVGRLSPEKNLPLLVRTVAALGNDNVHLAVVGDGASAAEVAAVAHDLGIAPRVHLVGREADTPRCHGAFDVFALTSTTEQLPMALLEAMACAKPAIVSDVGDCRYLLEGEAGFCPVVPSGDLEALVAALGRLVGDPDLRRRQGERNRRTCEASYASPRMIDRYRQLFESLAGRAA